MQEYDRKNTFILFYETDKKTEKSPDFTGSFTDEHGKEWRIAAWERSSKSGKNFLSGKVDDFRPKETGSTAPSWEAQREKFTKKDDVVTDVPSQADLDEDILRNIPF
jgi:hypothetical protein